MTDAVPSDDEEGLQVAGGQDVSCSQAILDCADPAKVRRQYLDYDLEALHAFIKLQRCEHVFVAFEDSEGFDSGLLSDLIPLFK